MEAQFDADGRPIPPLFQQAVTEFAKDEGLEPEPLIHGNALKYHESRFWLMHYGDDDPDGLTILMDVGEPPEEPGAQVTFTTPLLEYHLAVPVASHGYYGYVPQVNRLVYCTRIALDEVDSGAEAIASAIATSTQRMRDVRRSLTARTHLRSTAGALAREGS